MKQSFNKGNIPKQSLGTRLKNLRYHGVIPSLPQTIPKKFYLQIEVKFYRFASSIGISTDELDLVFWSKEAGEILK